MQSYSDYLKEIGLLSQTQINEIYGQAAKENSTFYTALMHSDLLDENVIIESACRHFDMYFVRSSFLVKADVETTEKIDNIFNMSDKKTFALKTMDETVILIPDPENTEYLSKITEKLGMDTTFALAEVKTMRDIYNRLIKPIIIAKRGEKLKVDNSGLASMFTANLKSDAQQLYHNLLDSALTARASDLHIVPLIDRANVDFRVDGKLYNYSYIPKDALENIKGILVNEAKVGANTKPFDPIDGKARYLFKGKEIDIRISIIPSKMGYDIVLRFLGSEIKPLNELGMSKDTIKRYNKLLSRTKGLVIVTGPTGSGKSTTMYSGLSKILKSNRKICTIEDPVEITLPGITQIDVKKETGFTYANAVKSTLRHDPDVIVVGEIRDLEVAQECIRAANTGHNVFVTLHTNDALGAITRLVNIGVDPYSIGDVLVAVMSQRLVRRICPKCKTTYELPENSTYRNIFKLGKGKITLAKGTGCSECNGTGYYDRIVISEILMITPELRHAIQTRQSRTKLEEILRNNNFKTMIDDGIEKALNQITTFDEILPYMEDIIGGEKQRE